MLKFGSPTLLRSLFVSFVKPPLLPTVKKPGLDFLTESVRYTGFFNRLTGEQLWKGVTSVSNAGRKKGRGRGLDKKGARNLNIGKKFGAGKIRVIWPGLNTPLIRNQEVQAIKETKEETSKAVEPPSPVKKKKVNKLHILDRGWSGRSQGGRKIGPPEPIQDETFEDFQSIVLENKMASRMTSVLGRKRIYFSIVATGNKKGLIGLGRAKSIDSKTAISLARTRASKRLISIDLLDGHTVNHDFFCEYGRTKIFAFKRSEGYGLRCHRIITALCELIGIKNLTVKVEGAKNNIHIIRAFIIGLLKQKTYQQIADESKLHLVEFRNERSGFPRVLASPEKCLTLKEARENPIEFEEFVMGGKLTHFREKPLPFYMKLPSWTVHLKRTLYQRNIKSVKMNLMSEYGALRSHLSDVYPECTGEREKRKKSA